MTSEVTNAGPAQASTLLRTWESASVSTVWLRPGDWYTPAADALVEALQAGKDTAPAAYRLGQARAAAGVGIFAISTFDTDYVLVQAHQLDIALRALRGHGHHVSGD